jgi:hypothetical protein
MGFYLLMNTQSKLEQIRDLVKSKLLEVQPFSGEEMNLLQTDPHRDGFVDGERTLAARILTLIDGDGNEVETVEAEMVLGR